MSWSLREVGPGWADLRNLQFRLGWRNPYDDVVSMCERCFVRSVCVE